MKTYDELVQFKTLEERFNYLQVGGTIGIETFGFDRYLNQALYTSTEWKKVRDIVLIRDGGCDLGIEGYEIYDYPIIHHMNAITRDQVIKRDPIIFDPNLLITCSRRTHNAIHYGDESILPKGPIERKPNDTIPWRK